MTSGQAPTNQDSLQPRDELIAEAMAAYERDGQAALKAACLAHPDLADELRRSAAMLDLLQRAAALKPPSTRGGDGHATVPSSSIGPGTVIAGFRIEASLGGGGMGHVFRARDLQLDRDVALKILSIPFASRGSAVDRIRKEARLLAQVRHDHIVRVHEVGETDTGLPFFVMDLVDGVPLSDVLARLHGRDPAKLTADDLDRACGATSPPARGSYAEAVVRLVLPIADALAAAHRAGVIHRDIKPGNILIDRTGRAHLVDFGIARETDSQSLSTLGHAGTPAYMAPEQVSGADPHDISAATDVYGLGITLYEALTLRRPFEDKTTANVYWRILNEEPPRPRDRNPAISVDLETICLAAIEKRPAERYARASEVADDLRSLLELRPIRRRPLGRAARSLRFVRRNPWPVTAAAALFLAVGALFYATHAFRQGDRGAQRISFLVADGYATLGTNPIDYEHLRTVVAELNELDPERGDVLDFNEVLRRQGVRVTADRHEALAAHVLEGLEELLASQGELDTARIDALYETAITAINEMALLRPERGEMDLLFGEAFALRRRSLLARSSFQAAALAPASAAGLADLLIEGAPAGASAFLFRYELQSDVVPGGEARLVAVPVRPRPSGTGEAPQHATIERIDPLIPPGADVLVVESVEAGSPAARAGLQRGDLVLEVAGRPVHTGVVVLPQQHGAASEAPTGQRPVDVAAFTRVTRLRDRDVSEAFDLDFILQLTSEGSEYTASVETLVADDQVQHRSLTVRRTPHGYDPAFGPLAEALSGPLPAEGVELVVLQGFVRRTVRLEGPEATGLRLTPTCYPVVCTPDNCVGTLPLALTGLPPGSWLVVTRAPGFEDLRLPMRLEAGRVTLARADMLPDGTTPPGFVYVAPGPYLAGAAGREKAWPPEERWIEGYWFGRTEITVGEYLEFLNDDETLAAIRESERTRTLLRVPREIIIDRPAGSTCRAFWTKEDGRYVSSQDPRRPIKDIACEDADAYCRWRTARSRDGWIFRLPSEDEWEKAARGVDGRACPWGDRLALDFPTSEHGRNLIGLSSTDWSELVFQPVTRPTRDESPYGARDAAGSVLEWCIGTFSDVPFRRPWRGGYARGLTEDGLQCSTRMDGYSDHVGRNDGFRIVAWRRSPGE